MRFYDFLFEARRNPDLNPKIGLISVLEKYKDRDDVYISFTEIPKLGINPQTNYETPAGIYAYPLKEYWEKIENNRIDFAGDRKYVQVFSANLKDVSDYTKKIWKMT